MTIFRAATDEWGPQNFYHMMLGLPAVVDAPDHYELLGIERFEDDIERIRTAAIDRNRKLLSWQNSEFHADADQLMNEIVAAREVLSDPRRKAVYDGQRGRGNAAVQDEALARAQPSHPAAVSRPVPTDPGSQDTGTPATSKSPRLPAPMRRTKRKPSAGRSRALAQETRRSIDADVFQLGPTGTMVLVVGIILTGSWLFLGGWQPSSRPASTGGSPGQPSVTPVLPLAAEQAIGNQLTAREQESAANAASRQEAQAAQMDAARALGRDSLVERNSIDMELVLIPPGTFLMGSPASDPEARETEHPQVQVTLTQPLCVGTTEVTQGQWQAVMNTAPWSQFLTPVGTDFPATYVSFDDAQEFCAKLSEKEGVTYRLLSEAEREYACRAGTTTTYCFGTSADMLAVYAWFKSDLPEERFFSQVGQKRPNAYGLYDMHGNVREWCADWFGSPLEGGIDPAGPPAGSYRVIRDGYWRLPSGSCRSASRGGGLPSDRSKNVGFRVCTVPSAGQ